MIKDEDKSQIKTMYFEKMMPYSAILDYYAGKYIYADLKSFINQILEVED